jgi:hypothetical protein
MAGLTGSRKVSRTAPMKGVKAISFAPFTASDPVVNTPTGVIVLPVGMTTPPAIARVEVKATGNNIVETYTFDEATRTGEWVGVNTFFIPGNDLELRNQIQGYAGILQTMFIEDYNGKYYVLGSRNGCDVMTVVGGSDSQGFTVTVNSKELEAAYTLATAGVTDYLSGLLPEA